MEGSIMPGLKILHYLVNVGYNDPTQAYAVVELDNGDLQMAKVLQAPDMPLEYLLAWYSNLEVKRPIVLVDPSPPVIELFRSRGIRIR
jgi:hypothetical protein